jgi:hypothetical protein
MDAVPMHACTAARSDNADLFPNMHPTCAAAFCLPLFRSRTGQKLHAAMQPDFFFSKTLTFVEEEKKTSEQ